MFHLVIARGKKCEYCKIIKSDNYEELSKYTTKFYNSNEIRENNKNVVNSFYYAYGIQGDIVIMNDELNNQRFRVLYKNDVKIVKELIKSQNLMKYLVSNNLLLVSPYDYKAIMYYKSKDYIKHMKDFLKRKKNFYSIIRVIVKGYEKYQKKHRELPSLYCLEKSLINDSLKDKNYKEESSTKDDEYYNMIFNSFENGGYEEIFNDYSLDELELKLDNTEFKKLVKANN